jgi:DNA uptake protein ComE-like DNA-binding protein
MAPRHWLDPLARRLLIATGQIPAPAQLASRRAAEALAEREAALDAELEDLKRRRSPGLVDVNRATASDWRQLPGCTAEQVDLLMRLQAGGVQLCGPEDLAEVLRLEPQVLREWLPRLVFHWYGEPPPLPPAPVAINRASAAELRERLALSGHRLTRLRAERARAPFRDLADLQERLALPAALVEAWIGRLSFELPDPAIAQASEASEDRPPRQPRGPSLPPTPSRGRTSSPAPRRRTP